MEVVACDPGRERTGCRGLALGLALGVCYWFVDALIDAYTAGATTSVVHSLFYPNSDSLVMRLVTAALSCFFGGYVQILLNRNARMLVRLRALARLPEENPQGIIRVNPQGRICYANSAASSLLEGLGVEYEHVLSGEAFDAIVPLVKARTQGCVELQIDGKEYEIRVVPSETQDSSNLYARDVTQENAAEEHMRLALAVVEHTNEAVLVSDENNQIVTVNASFSRITGYAKEEVIGKNPNMMSSGRHDKAFYEKMWKIIQEKGTWTGEIWNRRKSGEVFPEWLSISRVLSKSGKTAHYVALFSDISMQKAEEDALRHRATHDDLTGLPNRLLLRDRLEKLMIQAKRRNHLVAVLYIDLDGFKAINDNYGHAAGDEVLVVSARRLTEIVRAEDTVARIGGDEFVVVLGQLNDMSATFRVKREIEEKLSQPIPWQSGSVSVFASCGCSQYPDDSMSGSELISRADAAMYKVKEHRKNSLSKAPPHENFSSQALLHK